MSWVNFDERMPGLPPTFVDPINGPWAKTLVRMVLKAGDGFELYVLFKEEPESADVETLKEVSARILGVETDEIKEAYWYEPD